MGFFFNLRQRIPQKSSYQHLIPSYFLEYEQRDTKLLQWLFEGRSIQTGQKSAAGSVEKKHDMFNGL